MDTYNLLDLFNNKELVKICAPMVRYSKYQFRTLVREFGCDLCFTPMILADSFCQSQKARDNEFIVNTVDQPLVVQFAANTVHDFVGAADLVAPYCNGVDLNCGCPQRWAKCQGIGCVMLENPQLIYDLVRECRNHVSKPFTVSVKMRILSDTRQSVSVCQQLEHCGVSFLTVHGRTPSQKVDDVNINALRLISESVHCPVIANGGVRNLKEATTLHNFTRCKGVMVANGILTNPALFTGASETPIECIQKWVDICFNSEYSSTYHEDPIDWYFSSEANAKPLTFQCFHHHLVFMLEKVLPKRSRRIFNNLQKFRDVIEFLEEHLEVKVRKLDNFMCELYKPVPMTYESDFSKYSILLDEHKNEEKKKMDLYDYNLNHGKYFSSVVSNSDDDSFISDLFLEY